MLRRSVAVMLVAGPVFVLPASVQARSEAVLPPQSGFAPALEMIGIRDIQAQLAAHGYDAGPPTGAMSETTQRAILAYERDYGLPQDGMPGPLLQNALHFMPRRAAPQLAALTPQGALPPVAPMAPVIAPPAMVPQASPRLPVAEAPIAAPPPEPAAAAPAADAALAVAPDAAAAPQAPVAPAEAAAPQTPVAPAEAAAEPAEKDAAPALAAPAEAPTPSAEAASSFAAAQAAPAAAPAEIAVPPDSATAALAAAEAPPAAAPAALALAPAILPAIAAPAAMAASAADPLGAAIPVAVLGSPDVAAAPGDASVREAQEYLKRLGYYEGDIDGVLSWRTVQALVKFDASGDGPKTVIAKEGELDQVWLARLKTAAATRTTPTP
jgi:peptidoglycan hydrolase-like protein with peptidoglycan-binding domain